MNCSLVKSCIKTTLLFCTRPLNAANAAIISIAKRDINTTNSMRELMEFFDTKKNWAESNIRVGRSWRLDELRIKSNTDLHKLWYVLLKERNMLYTMEHEFKDNVKLFPNPERIDKVQESMNNIETVIRERNVAYYRLETGETGERPVENVVNLIGLREKYQKSEYFLPMFMNTRWIRPYLEHGFITSMAVKKFKRLYNEKLHRQEKKARNRDFNHVQHLLKRYPDMSIETLKAEYPYVDIEKAMRSRKSRGHFVPKY